MAKKKVELADFCKKCQRRHIENKGYKADKEKKEIIKWRIKWKKKKKNHFESCRYNESWSFSSDKLPLNSCYKNPFRYK